jgi:hypothetical protein
MKKEEEVEYFFFSRKQLAYRARGAISSGSPLKRTFCQLKDGSVLEYTERGSSKTPKCRYNDIKFLGNGRHYHCHPETIHKDDDFICFLAKSKRNARIRVKKS